MPSSDSSYDFDEVLWSDHAEEKMTERKVDEMEVVKTLTCPDRLYPGNRLGRWVAERDGPDESTVRVVYVIEDSDEVSGKLFAHSATVQRRRRESRSIEYEAYLAAVVVTVIRIKKRKQKR